jgi:hypothetical protein
MMYGCAILSPSAPLDGRTYHFEELAFGRAVVVVLKDDLVINDGDERRREAAVARDVLGGVDDLGCRLRLHALQLLGRVGAAKRRGHDLPVFDALAAPEAAHGARLRGQLGYALQLRTYP